MPGVTKICGVMFCIQEDTGSAGLSIRASRHMLNLCECLDAFCPASEAGSAQAPHGLRAWCCSLKTLQPHVLHGCTALHAVAQSAFFCCAAYGRGCNTLAGLIWHAVALSRHFCLCAAFCKLFGTAISGFKQLAATSMQLQKALGVVVPRCFSLVQP